MSSIERDVYDGNLSAAALAHASRVATADPGRSLVKITIEDKCWIPAARNNVRAHYSVICVLISGSWKRSSSVPAPQYRAFTHAHMCESEIKGRRHYVWETSNTNNTYERVETCGAHTASKATHGNLCTGCLRMSYRTRSPEDESGWISFFNIEILIAHLHGERNKGLKRLIFLPIQSLSSK